jgi:hypothetical protein
MMLLAATSIHKSEIRETVSSDLLQEIFLK